MSALSPAFPGASSSSAADVRMAAFRAVDCGARLVCGPRVACEAHPVHLQLLPRVLVEAAPQLALAGVQRLELRVAAAAAAATARSSCASLAFFALLPLQALPLGPVLLAADARPVAPGMRCSPAQSRWKARGQSSQHSSVPVSCRWHTCPGCGQRERRRRRRKATRTTAQLSGRRTAGRTWTKRTAKMRRASAPAHRAARDARRSGRSRCCRRQARWLSAVSASSPAGGAGRSAPRAVR